jgi:hypothetical protein
MNRSTIQHGSAERRVSPNGVRVTDPLRLGHPPILRDQAMPATIDDINQGVAGFTESSGGPSDRAQDRSNLGRRTRRYGGLRTGMLRDFLVRGRVDARKRLICPRNFFDSCKACPALQAGVCLRRVLLLAPRALHRLLPRAGRGLGSGDDSVGWSRRSTRGGPWDGASGAPSLRARETDVSERAWLAASNARARADPRAYTGGHGIVLR